MLAPIRHILPLTTIRRERLLPLPGRVIVRKGQKVATTDVLAEARLAPEHLLLDVMRGLHLGEEQADLAIKCKGGMKVAEGDVLAGPVGLTKRVVRSPRNGRVVLTGGGQILLEVDSTPFQLMAGVPGTVFELLDDRGAIVEATGALVQGVWGNGRIDYGLMYVLAKTPEDILSAAQMDVSLRGAVVLAVHCKHVEVLKAANDLPLRGLILASMDASLAPTALKVRYPIVVIDGFGQIPMNSAAFRLLSTNERREIAVNGEEWDPEVGVRPELFIPLPASGELPLPPEMDVFNAGQQVLIIRAPYSGKTGTILDVRPGLTALPNGLSTQAALIQVEGGEAALIPLANLEVLE
jgi:hypothetical protein